MRALDGRTGRVDSSGNGRLYTRMGDVPALRYTGPIGEVGRRRVRALATQLGVAGWMTVGHLAHRNEEVGADGYGSRVRKPVALGRLCGCRDGSGARRSTDAGHPVSLGELPRLPGTAIQVDADASSVADGILQLMSPTAREIGGHGADVARRELSEDAVARSWLDQLLPLFPPPGVTQARDA